MRTVSTAGIQTIGDPRLVAGNPDVDDRSVTDRGGKCWWTGPDYTIDAHLLRAQYVQSRPDHISDSKSQAFAIGYKY